MGKHPETSSEDRTITDTGTNYPRKDNGCDACKIDGRGEAHGLAEVTVIILPELMFRSSFPPISIIFNATKSLLCLNKRFTPCNYGVTIAHGHRRTFLALVKEVILVGRNNVEVVRIGKGT